MENNWQWNDTIRTILKDKAISIYEETPVTKGNFWESYLIWNHNNYVSFVKEKTTTTIS